LGYFTFGAFCASWAISPFGVFWLDSLDLINFGYCNLLGNLGLWGLDFCVLGAFWGFWDNFVFIAFGPFESFGPFGAFGYFGLLGLLGHRSFGAFLAFLGPNLMYYCVFAFNRLTKPVNI
jgi:hypothetical protein